MEERRTGQARPKMHFSSVKCIYFPCPFLCLVMKGAEEKEAGMPHYGGRAPRLRGGAPGGDRILVKLAKPTALP